MRTWRAQHFKSVPRVSEKDEPISIGTIRTLAACLSELLELYARSDVHGHAQNLCELLDCPQRPVHRQAIVDAIEVLKKTKDTFKSKALAELRTKLENLLGPGLASAVDTDRVLPADGVNWQPCATAWNEQCAI